MKITEFPPIKKQRSLEESLPKFVAILIIGTMIFLNVLLITTH